MREAPLGPQRTPVDHGCADDGMMCAAGLGLGVSFLCSVPVLWVFVALLVLSPTFSLSSSALLTH